jgi:hypothetical protein
MYRPAILIRGAVLGLILFLTSLQPALAAPPSPPAPDGFRQLLSGIGVTLYQKDYANGTPDYVQVIDLSQGAVIEPLLGEITDPGTGKGVYGGDNPKVARYLSKDFWQAFSASSKRAFCITNGQFFLLKDSPTTLPFPIKKDGKVVSDGYAIKEFPEQKLMLEIWPDRVDITELSKEALYSSSAPDIIGGLTEDANKSAKKSVGRTFIGILDRNQDQRYETVLIFSTKTAKQEDAGSVLRSFGAQKIMMLDGGDSTQLICQDNAYISSERLIPQAIGIAAGTRLLATATPVLTEPSPATPASQANQAFTSRSAGSWKDVLWVPLIMLPVVIVLLFVVLYLRRNPS